ncbi:hypothetical protein EPN52_14265 [bacterium]|nr:MAG: hypothetical protein EPN52_14265 [bacterium]
MGRQRGGPPRCAGITEDNTTLPRLYPATIERPRIARWFDGHNRLPMRLVVAPPGWGKTTALAAYARQEQRAVYHRLSQDQNAAACCAGIAAAAGLQAAPGGARELLEALGTLLPLTLLLDDVQLACPQVQSLVDTLLLAAPAELGIVAASRSRTAIAVDRWVTEGIAAQLGPAELAFDQREVAQLALRLGVRASETGVVRLLRHTEGWPIAVAGSLRVASALRLSIEDAYDAWRRDNGSALRDFVSGELARTGSWAEADMRRLLAEPGAQSREPYAQRLEREGLFVRGSAGVARLQAVVANALAPSDEQPSATAPEEELAPLCARLFGPFDARIGVREIAWVRRRDQRIVQYLLLRPDCSATREELITTFWPDAGAAAATQSLRTAASNIRKAISALVGAANVERYFCSRGEVALRVHSLAVDVRQFRAHVGDGDHEYEAGHTERALTRYRAAEVLYQGDLLTDELDDAWLAARRENLRALFAHVLERITEIWSERGETELAGRYAERLAQLQQPHAPAAATARRKALLS